MAINIRKSGVALVTIVLVLCVALSARSAQATKLVEWRDLIPKLAEFEDPFEKLTREQISDLSEVAYVRERLAAAKSLTPREQSSVAKAEAKLKDQGIDIDGLLARRFEIRDKRRAAAQAIDPGLNGQDIRMAGYLLPLEFSSEATTEFLLVPYVGACIHVPPPPPNQIVHVVYENGFQPKGLYTPVWVSGKISTGLSEKNLFLVDGATDVSFGYQMTARSVERYRK